MALSFRPYNPETDAVQFSNLVHETYGPASFLHHPAYVKWWFASSPFRHAKNPTDVLAGFYNEQMIAINCHIAAELVNDGESFPIHWIVNTMVHPKYRRGVGLNLISESIKHFGDIATISYNEHSAPVLKHLGFQLFEGRTLSRALSVTDKAAFSAVVPDFNINTDKNSEAASLLRISSSTDLQKAEALFQKVKQRYGLTQNRSASYIKWRFLDHPAGKYEISAIEVASELKAVSVTRVDGTEFKALRIVDLFGEEEYITPILQSLKEKSRNESCAYVDFYGTEKDKSAFEAAGFTWLDEKQKSEVPFLLNPLASGKTFNENVGLHINNTKLNESLQLEDLYFTKADADRDRPQR